MSFFDLNWGGSLVLHVTIILIVAACFDAAAGRLAAFRHWINLTAIVLILFSPISVVVLQQMDPGWRRVSWIGQNQSTVEPESVESPSFERHITAPRQMPTDEVIRRPHTVTASAAVELPDEMADAIDGANQPISLASRTLQAEVQTATPAPEAQPRWLDVLHAFTPVALATWCLGSMVLLLRLTVSLLRVRQLMQAAHPVSTPRLLDAFADACKHVGADGTRIALVTSDRIDTPMAAGILHPHVVLPAEMPSTATRQQMREVMIHKLAHVVRRDQFVVLLQHLAAALYWWHPLVYRVNRRLAQAREDVCDNYVLADSDGTQYSQTLLEFAERRCGRWAPSSVAGLFSSQWKLEHRVASLLDRRRNRATRVSARGWIVVAMATCIAVGLGSLASMAWANETPQSPANQPPANQPADGSAPAETDDADANPNDAQPETQIQGTVRNEQGQPIPDATVLLVHRVGEDRQLFRTTGKTDKAGRYRFNDLPVQPSEMSYISVRVYSPGYAIGQKNLYRYPPQAGHLADSVDIDVSLVPADACVINVVNEQGEPVAGALLEQLNTNGAHASNLYLFAEDWEQFGVDLPRSDAAGNLTIPAIDRSRNYDLRLSHTEYAATPLWKVEFGSEPLRAVIEKGDKVRFVVTSESDPDLIDQATIDATISEDGGHSVLQFDVDTSGVVEARLRDKHTTITIEHPTLEGLPWYFYDTTENEFAFTLHRTGIAEGKVVHARTGKGLPDVGVQFVRSKRVIKFARTDADGHYSCRLAEGEYLVSVSESSGEWKASETRVSVDVVASQTVSIDPMTVEPESMIRGKVMTASGEPVPGAIIVPDLRRSPIIADENGEFELEPGRRGQTRIHVFHPYQRLSRFVASATETETLRIRLSPEGVIHGVLRDGIGKTLPGLMVGLGVRGDSLAGSGRGSFRTTLLRDFTDEYGFIQFAGLSEGLEYRLIAEGESRARFGQRAESSSDWYSVSNLPSDSVELEVGSKLLTELGTTSAYQEAPPRIKPLGPATWIDERRIDVEAMPGRFVLISFAWHPFQLKETQLCKQFYGDRGLAVVGVLTRVTDSALDDQTLEKFDFPIAIDNQEARISERYGQADGIGSVVYDTEGKRVRTIRRSDNLLSIVRSIMLYDERLPK
ncbi:Regulatory protein BlaR1 [Stieleria neptunia]|uniref:Regulatory protein BlaR1 n=1 Tax=Stieleria neptunia TaxID=2527979 RepID=A0A518I2I8_9BACT|nr:M56 family metallopeptidase [Stieleria neptunia]QDV47323.1 Regulatory protein BlaR1 [Stieleria neptunia]